MKFFRRPARLREGTPCARRALARVNCRCNLSEMGLLIFIVVACVGVPARSQFLSDENYLQEGLEPETDMIFEYPRHLTG
jgi:hypothetical protein